MFLQQLPQKGQDQRSRYDVHDDTFPFSVILLASSKSSSRNKKKTANPVNETQSQNRSRTTRPIHSLLHAPMITATDFLRKGSLPIDRPDHASAVSIHPRERSTARCQPRHALPRSSAVVRGANTVLRAVLTSPSVSGLVMSHPNKPTADAARSADPSAVLSR